MSENAGKKRTWWMPVVILLLGISLRVIYFVEIRQEPEFAHPIYDPEYNAYWARSLATGNWNVPAGMPDPEIRTTPHGRPPGYPWFLAAVYSIFGVNDYAPRIIQMLIGLANALLLYGIGKRLFGNTAGFISGVFMAVYWVFPYFEGILTYPSVAVFVMLLLFTTLLQWCETGGRWHLLLAGMLLGIFALFRPNGLLIAPCILGWMGWVSLAKVGSLKRAAILAALFITGCVGVLTPPFIRNYCVAHDFVFISSYGGINFYVGNHPEASLVEPRIPELIELAGIEHWSCFDYPSVVRGLAVNQGRDSMKFSEANRYFYRKAFSFITKQPLVFLRNMGLKTLLLFGPCEITNDTVMEYDKRFSNILGHMPGFPWVLGLFLFGLLMFAMENKTLLPNTMRHLRPYGWLLILIFVFYSLSVLIYFVAGRYRVPLIPIMLLFSACGLVHLVSMIKKRRLALFSINIVVLSLLIYAAHWNSTGYSPSEATWHLRRAMAFTAQGETQKAQEEYLRAEKLGADSSIVYANLGRIHFEKGETHLGLGFYKRGLAKNPNNAIIRNNLGYELYKLHDLDEAIEHLTHAVRVNPRFFLARMNLGNALADKGELDAALAQFVEAECLNSNEPAAPYNVARMFFLKGDYHSAIFYYQRSLSIVPDYPLALNNLGYCLEIQGKYEEAIPYYERAIAADPAFVLAYNNLGNALAAAGRLEQAERVLLEALHKAPEDYNIHYNLGRIYASSKSWDQAYASTQEALRINSDYVPALVQLGLLHSKSGEKDLAIKALERAKALSPDDAAISEQLYTLREEPLSHKEMPRQQ
ncbi:MAG TPA: tetratricopeptide repeat protein [Candidatus Hydrogenedentes bacterium]|nr:tetratricopeptide repeat protein [Candidatus Hydrogenedentota bacterium]